jgi:ribonucleoside-diphosphate reductase alpha chain
MKKPENTPAKNTLPAQIWDMKYRLKDADGSPVDASIEDTWERIALSLASAEPEETREAWQKTFKAALENYKFLPAGRIMAGAGAGRSVTLFNCFVMGTIEDHMGGIFDALKEAALTMQQGGGIGYDFSTIRPCGAPVKGVGADASGPLSFMDVWDAMCRTIMSAGSRRGAMMAVMRCDHPDIEAFIEAKRDPVRLRMFNLSVLATDDFMAAVKADANWDLVFDGTTYRTLKARDLWHKIMRSTFDFAEPGVIFIDRINQENNLHYCETIAATNPCLSGDTWVSTDKGPRQIDEIIGEPVTLIVDGILHASDPRGFFQTGIKPLLKISTKEGFALKATDNHLIRKVTLKTRFTLETEWVEAGDLKPGDEVLLNDHREAPSWPTVHSGMNAQNTKREGYLMGLLVSDGTLKEDAAILSVWPNAAVSNGDTHPAAANGIMKMAEAAARQLPHRRDFSGWMEVPGRGEYRLKLAAVRDLALELGMSARNKTITPAIEKSSSEFHTGFLRGLFDADGSVQGSQAKGVSIRLSQSDLPLLEAAQRMLARLGIIGKIYKNRRDEGTRLLPDGKGGNKAYEVRAQHELVISGENLEIYRGRVGFSDVDKTTRLTNLLSGYKRSLNRERFLVRVESVEPCGEEPVFDVAVPGINAFDANGLYVHNCGEQPLPPYGACLLGSINLARLVSDPFSDDAAIDETALSDLVTTAVRMMDNVVDVSRFPLEEQAHEAKAKRRIGLGVTGVADALIMCKTRYGSDASVALIDKWLGAIERAAYLASAGLAKEKGAFPLFDKDKYLAGAHISRLDEDVRDAIATSGVRNALVTSIAPTGTISLFADNVSSGIEPVFSYVYERKVLKEDGTHMVETVSDYAHNLYIEGGGDPDNLPDYFVSTQTLTPKDHVRVQAAAQVHVDSSISKTINCPEDISFEDFQDIYLNAFESGCKGCTTYRPNAITGSILTVIEDKPSEAAIEEIASEDPANDPTRVVYMTKPLDRPGSLGGATYKVRWPESDHAIYITINDIEQDGRQRPFEIFINSKNMEHYAWTVALTRMISAVFRRGGDVTFVVDELKAVFDPRGGQWMQGRYVPSLLAAIGEVIEEHMKAIGFLAGGEPELVEAARKKVEAQSGSRAGADAEITPLGATCPKCSMPSLTRLEGCETCLSCGHSKCS